MVQSNSSTTLDALSRKNLLILTGFSAILLLAATVIFGLYVLAIAFISYGASLAIEVLFAKVRNKKIDYGWMVTPIIFALLMPPSIPLWMVAVGSSFGTMFGKSIFGGLGKNIFNPAVVGVLFVTISFPAYLNTMWLDPVTKLVQSTTPLTVLNSMQVGMAYKYQISDLLFGMTPGVLGETFRIGIILLGVALMILKISDWRIPTYYLGSFFLVSGIAYLIDPVQYRDPVLSLLVGGILFVAFFVATDPVSAPLKPIAKVFYGIGLGLLTFIIRNYAAFPEGVIFAIIIMNAVAPLLDTFGNENNNDKKIEIEVTM